MTASGFCSNQAPVPARLDITPGKAKAYTQCENTAITDSVTPYYIVNDSRYQWIMTNKTDMYRYNNTAVILKGGTYSFMIARVKKDNYTAVAKVHIDINWIGAHYPDPVTNTYVGPVNYEILVCRASEPYTVIPSTREQ